jgi:hypothetical protein
MTAKEKALELVQRFEIYADYHECDAFSERQRMRFNALSIALITVKEIIEEHLFDGTNTYVQKRIDYWEEVKQEIKQL